MTVAPELRFLLPPRLRGHPPVRVALDGTSSLVHVLEALGIPRTEIGHIRVGCATATLSAQPRAGDAITVEPVERPQRGLPERYLLDVHLGTLARRLRLLGLDAGYERSATDDELVARAAAEHRVLLTRDRGILRRRALVAGALVRGDLPDDQLADVLDRFAPALAPWTRCPACNGRLHPVPVQAVAHLLQPGTLRTYRQFSRCSVCGRPYWRGAHARKLQDVVAAATTRHPDRRTTGLEPGEVAT